MFSMSNVPLDPFLQGRILRHSVFLMPLFVQSRFLGYHDDLFLEKFPIGF